LSIILFPLGLWLGHGATEKHCLCGSVLLVMSAELAHSAVEAVVDKSVQNFMNWPAAPRTWFSGGFSANDERLLCWPRAVAAILKIHYVWPATDRRA